MNWISNIIKEIIIDHHIRILMDHNQLICQLEKQVSLLKILFLVKKK